MILTEIGSIISCFLHFIGGKVAVPMDSSENKQFTSIAEEYYKTCEAEEQSGKTAWIGIAPDEDTKPVRWRVSHFFVFRVVIDIRNNLIAKVEKTIIEIITSVNFEAMTLICTSMAK